MPKLLVLFDGAESASASLLDAAATAAKAVRFTEVDIRSTLLEYGTSGARHKALESAHTIEHYDGVLIVGAGGPMTPGLGVLFDTWERASNAAFENTVFAATGFDNAEVLERLAQLGGIIVAAPRGTADAEGRAKTLGGRMAKVVEWVRHALSHEQAHDHQHHHDHPHAH
jgi:hypothetical protein